jgi:formylglycine-generating enzyme required for sulfatase activity
MKKIILSLILLLPVGLQATDNPQIIYSKTKVIESVDWYYSQSLQWYDRVSHHRTDVEAWVNYYLSSRYAQAPKLELDKIVSDMQEVIPGSYEFYLVKGWNAGFSVEAGDYLNKAFTKRPDHPASYASLLLFHEYMLQDATRKEFSQRLFQSNELSQSLLNYSYNVLMSLADGAILFTEGDNTTLPLFVLQDVMNVRRDVHILNLDMLHDITYRDAKLRSLHLKISSDALPDDLLQLKKTLCTLLPEQNPEKKFYYALTLSQENITSIKNQLYVVGLASMLSKNRIDNISAIKENFENQFLLDYLTVDFNGESKTAAGKVLNANYLVPMLMLDQHYLKNGETEKAKDLESILMKLADETNKTDAVQNFLNRERVINVPYFKYTLNLKETEGPQKLIKGNIYAQEFEITNKQYNEFLNYLKQNNLMQQYDKFKFDLSSFDEPALSFMKGYSAPRAPYKKQKFFINHPAVSITYEGAQAYCSWLTDQYNAQDGRKFKKVVFRLPSVQEWQVAALGYKEFQSWTLDDNTIKITVPKDTLSEITKDGDVKMMRFSESHILYPWFQFYNYRNKYLNKFDCALGNFKFDDRVTSCMTHNHMPTADGFTMMAPVGAYFPNGMGLYDVVGNVAEMTNEKGKACGGSWNHKPEESTIESINTFEGPDIAVGFRVFMEVIEH